MINGNNVNILDLYFKKKKNIMKTADHLILKKPIIAKPKCMSPSFSRNFKFNTPLKKDYRNDSILQNININNNKDQEIKLKIQKYKKLLLPTLSTNRTTTTQKSVNTPKNKTYRTSKENKTKLIKIKKINFFSFSPINNKYRHNKKLKGLYKENLIKKRILERYKESKNKNISNFSFQKYNEKLIQLSSMDISEDNFKIFKKNMKCIEKAMNGHSSLRNRYNRFFVGIEAIKTDDKKKKIESFSENKNENEQEKENENENENGNEGDTPGDENNNFDK